MNFIRVDFPAPFGPKRPMRLGLFISKEILKMFILG
jgi:hypothetical protein